MRAVVVGAGIGGLAAAMALSRLGHDVLLLERDDTPMPDDIEAAFQRNRRGAPLRFHSNAPSTSSGIGVSSRSTTVT